MQDPEMQQRSVKSMPLARRVMRVMAAAGPGHILCTWIYVYVYVYDECME
jgi:hypothetical protein